MHVCCLDLPMNSDYEPNDQFTGFIIVIFNCLYIGVLPAESQSMGFLFIFCQLLGYYH